MWLAIQPVSRENACKQCGSVNILIHSIQGHRLYGDYCSSDCRTTALGAGAGECIRTQPRAIRRPPPIILPVGPLYSPPRIIVESPTNSPNASYV